MRKNLQIRFLEREKQRIVLLNRARDNFAQIVKMIIEKYHPKRIYQWGSLIDGSHFTERSDIDIAIEGITSAEQFFAILGEAEKWCMKNELLLIIEEISKTRAIINDIYSYLKDKLKK